MPRQALIQKINEKFKSQAAFGLNIGWIPQKVYRMLYEGYEPRITEAEKISRALDIPLEELPAFFR